MKAIRHIRFRQLLLLVALILPTLGIAFAGQKILEDERAEIQATLKKAGEAIHESASFVLEGIKTGEIASSSTGNRESSDKAVLLVGSVVRSNGQMHPDWTTHLKIPQIGGVLGQDPQIVREITAAGSFEQTRDLEQAVSHYRAILKHLDSLSSSADSAVQQAAMEISGELKSHLDRLELASGIEAQFSSLNLERDKWKQFGDGIWLSLTPPTGPAVQELVIAVRGEDIVERVRDERSKNGNYIPFKVIPAPMVDGANAVPGDDSIDRVRRALGDRFPGLEVQVLADDQTRELLKNHRIFYAISLAFFLSVTLIGWYLMLRDTRNETRIAEMRSQFVSNVSHELRTPLTSILLFAETLRMRGLKDPQHVAEHLDTIISQSERLTRLLNNVLNFSKIERGQADYHKKLTRLDDVVRATARNMQFPLAEQGFNLNVDICSDLPQMRVDCDAVEQAILNLITNAMKYSGKSRDINLRMDSANGSALIQVADHGIGIAPGEQKRIFEKFYRVESPESSAASGVGIGLALVAHIARGHGGSVEVDSVLGKGSTFTIRIPIHENGNS